MREALTDHCNWGKVYVNNLKQIFDTNLIEEEVLVPSFLFFLYLLIDEVAAWTFDIFNV